MDHSWQDCRPVMLDLQQGRSVWAQAANQIKLEMAWSLVTHRDRRLFHEYCCQGRKSEDHLDAVERINRILEPALDMP